MDDVILAVGESGRAMPAVKRRLKAVRTRTRSAPRWSIWRRARRSADRRSLSRSCATSSRRRCAGRSDRIKGYTIAVEALGRADDFDPQADPIVRVEATRLRRALSRYYANGGSNDRGRDRSAARQLRAGVPPRRAAARGRSRRRSRRRLCRSRSPRRPSRNRPAGAGTARRLASRRGRRRLRGDRRGDLWRASISGSTSTRRPRRRALLAAPSRAGDAVARPDRPIRWSSSARSSSEAAARSAPPTGSARQAARRARAFRRDRIISGAPPEDERRRASLADGRAEPLRPDRERRAGSGGAHQCLDPPHRCRRRTRSRSRAPSSSAPRRRAWRRPNEAIVREVAVALAQPYGIIQARERGIR